MKIAIVGGGWVGCHMALNLRKKHNVTIFDKNSELFTETSSNNQNRLHYGYHYARNYKTRELCKTTFNRFINDYGFLITDIPKNLYCIPNKKSLIDFETYCQIFKDFNFGKLDSPINNIEGCINTNEKFINYLLAKDFFNKSLKDIFVSQELNYDLLVDMSDKYDLVINTTNNLIRSRDNDDFYELTVSFLYEKKNVIDFDAITLVDGNFFSIFPYGKNLVTLTDVEYTPLKKSLKVNELINHKNQITKNDLDIVRGNIEKKVLYYIPKFNDMFEYKDYFISIKSKIISESDERYPVIYKDDNIITCFTGKIQGIYIIENYINNLIND